MTDPVNNPLASRRSAPAASAIDRGNPRDIEGYCAWMNEREWRRGRWELSGSAPNRALEWKEEVASDNWLQQNGHPYPFCPSDDKRARIAAHRKWEAAQAARRDQERK